ncbi:MAG: phage tail tape measure protein, partial [Oscillospiraceae bacterium]|nr:phage tail tape measure protein [Oscillospiraceae bacterium]
MAGSYDGSIRINTAINAVPIDNGLAQIENKIKGLAATIGVAFGVKELINFSKRSIDAASDLAEAQNVVDTAFGDMSYKMEQFAATALETYGISELTAKNMGSTYMAMAKGMGVATDAASDMAVTLTGRLSDIMSFYNKTQSEVDTIGRALITGETEPLKAIGVVMTQTNLSAYAMAQGFAKTYDEMSSNEQLLVRYKYFLEQTALAQDDFAKTSEGWANQTRLLSERINEFMTNLGSIIMNVLTPALQFANEAVTFLNDLFFGGKTEEETTAAKNAEAITDEVTSMGTA